MMRLRCDQGAALGGKSRILNPQHQLPVNQQNHHHDDSAMAAMRRQLAQLQAELADVRQERQQLATETLGRAGEVRIVRQKLDKVCDLYALIL